MKDNLCASIAGSALDFKQIAKLLEDNDGTLMSWLDPDLRETMVIALRHHQDRIAANMINELVLLTQMLEQEREGG